MLKIHEVLKLKFMHYHEILKKHLIIQKWGFHTQYWLSRIFQNIFSRKLDTVLIGLSYFQTEFSLKIESGLFFSQFEDELSQIHLMNYLRYRMNYLRYRMNYLRYRMNYLRYRMNYLRYRMNQLRYT